MTPTNFGCNNPGYNTIPATNNGYNFSDYKDFRFTSSWLPFFWLHGFPGYKKTGYKQFRLQTLFGYNNFRVITNRDTTTILVSQNPSYNKLVATNSWPRKKVTNRFGYTICLVKKIWLQTILGYKKMVTTFAGCNTSRLQNVLAAKMVTRIFGMQHVSFNNLCGYNNFRIPTNRCCKMVTRISWLRKNSCGMSGLQKTVAGQLVANKIWLQTLSVARNVWMQDCWVPKILVTSFWLQEFSGYLIC